MLPLQAGQMTFFLFFGSRTTLQSQCIGKGHESNGIICQGFLPSKSNLEQYYFFVESSKGICDKDMNWQMLLFFVMD
jgi:hypothetical protein